MSKKRVYVLYRLYFTTYPGVRNEWLFRTLSGCVSFVADALRSGLFGDCSWRPTVYRAVFDDFDSVSSFDGADVTDFIFDSAREINSKFFVK